MSFQDGLNGYRGTRDTSIRGDSPRANYGSKTIMELDGKPDQISLVRWDSTAIPSSSTVISASLTFNVINTSTGTYAVYEALRAWNEKTATYQLAGNGKPWEVPGAIGSTDHSGDVLGTLSGPSRGLVTIQLNALGVAMVQNWITNPLRNYGIAIQDLTDKTTDDLGLSTSEATSISRRPKLTIMYLATSPSPAPAAAPTETAMVTVDTLLTNNLTPPLTGTVSNPEATISVTVGDQTRGAVNHGDGTWTVAEGELAPLVQGVYDVVVTATASGNTDTDATTNELTLDTTAPSTTLDFPVDGTRYRKEAWADSILGTVLDTDGGSLDSVEVSIRRSSDNRYWDGGEWDQTSELFLLATGTKAWSLSLPNAGLTDGVSYTVSAHGKDTASNIENTKSVTFTFDDTRPALTSFARQTPASNPTNVDTLIFRATFNESVRNVDAGDFAVAGTSATVANVTEVNPSTFDVTLAGGNLAGLNGKVGLNLASGQDIKDLAGNDLRSIEPTTDQLYVVDNTVAVPIVISLQDGLNGYRGTRDTSIVGNTPKSNFGTKTKMQLNGKPDQISLVRWDTTAIPSASTVISASLTFNVATTSIQTYEIYESLRAWDERTATYQLAASGKPWEVPGANGSTDHAGDVLGSLTGPFRGLVTIQLNALGVAMVQNWLSNPLKNYGIVIQDLSDKTIDNLEISSREQSRLGPKLTVNYTLGPPPSLNDPPIAAYDLYSVDEDESLSVPALLGILSNDTDFEGDTLNAVRVSDPSHGTLALNPNGSFVYRPDKNFNGADSFTYRVGDGSSRSNGGKQTDVGTVTISVDAEPDDPLAVDDSITTSKNSSRSFNVLSNDSDPDGKSISVADHTEPSHGTLSQNGGTFTYVPDNNYIGRDSFSYTIRDTTGRTADATVSISVVATSTPVTFRVMGDVPYSQGEFTGLKNDLANVGSNDLFFMHLGDIKAGSAACSPSAYSSVAKVLLASKETVFIVPGDNEWNDCSNPSQAWGYWDSNFSRFDEHWANDFTVRRQAQRNENFAFVSGGVLFIGLNLVGGRVHDSKEWAQRMKDNSQWVSDNMAAYGDQVSSAVLFAHTFPDGARQAFGTAFVDAAKRFAKPVLYLMGDKHSWKLDHPFSGAPNVTRVIVDQGVPSIRVTVTQNPVNPFELDRSP